MRPLRTPQSKRWKDREYFFLTWANRRIDPRSKRVLPDWYRGTAVDDIRPVEVEELSSRRDWEKWNRLSAEQVEQIGKAFFERGVRLRHRPLEEPRVGCHLMRRMTTPAPAFQALREPQTTGA